MRTQWISLILWDLQQVCCRRFFGVALLTYGGSNTGACNYQITEITQPPGPVPSVVKTFITPATTDLDPSLHDRDPQTSSAPDTYSTTPAEPSPAYRITSTSSPVRSLRHAPEND